MESSPLRVGTWMTGADGRRWFYDSGSVALDFAYSGDFGYGIPQWETLHTPCDLDDWFAARFGDSAGQVDHEQFASARTLRAAVSAAARARVDGQALDPHVVDRINETAAGPALSPWLNGGSTAHPAPTPERMLASLAQDAIHALSAAHGRLRRCSADDCGLIFLDTSRPGNRRWCSMSRCGGRAKARAHYQRHREGE